MAKEINTECTEYPTCPHCGEVDQDWWDGQPPRYDGDKWDVTCHNCDKTYQVELEVEWSFTTEKKEEK